MKINKISCCAECSALHKHNGSCLCTKAEKEILMETSDSVDKTLVSFPSWCPLENTKTTEGNCKDYRDVICNIIKILGGPHYSKALISEAAYYLNTVLE